MSNFWGAVQISDDPLLELEVIVAQFKPEHSNEALSVVCIVD